MTCEQVEAAARAVHEAAQTLSVAEDLGSPAQEIRDAHAVLRDRLEALNASASLLALRLR